MSMEQQFMVPALQELLYELNDNYLDPRAAGSINGTPPTPGPGGLRGAIDTNAVLTIAGKRLTATGASGVTYCDPGLYYPAYARMVGRVLVVDYVQTVDGRIAFGWSNDSDITTIANWKPGIYSTNNTNISVYDGTVDTTIGARTAGVAHKLVIVQRAAGSQIIVKGAPYTKPSLLYILDDDTTASLFPFVGSRGIDFNSDFMHALELPWMAAPVVSDGFSTTLTDGLGHAEGVAGGRGAGGAGIAWTELAGTRSIAGGIASAATLAGGVGVFSCPSGIGPAADYLVTCNPTITGTAAGMVVRVTDASNYVYAVHTGTNVQLVRVVAGAPTTMIDLAATYSAGSPLTVRVIGDDYWVFYNGALVNSASSGGKVPTSIGGVGLYFTDTNSTVDNFRVYAVGSNGELEDVNQWLN